MTLSGFPAYPVQGEFAMTVGNRNSRKQSMLAEIFFRMVTTWHPENPDELVGYSSKRYVSTSTGL